MKFDNKLILKKLFNRQKNNVNRLVRDYVRTEGYQQRKPKSKGKYLGIEVECFGPYEDVELQKMVFVLELEKYVQIGTDSSVRSKKINQKSYELRLLLPERRLGPLLKQIGKFFKLAKLQTNDTCGLHVHLDMRHRNFNECYKRLVRFQDALYALVYKARWTNSYCRYSNARADLWDKYRAISGSSYSTKRTIEVRLHHGTVDVNAIEKWIRLLLNVINKPELEKPPRTRADVLNWKGLQSDLKPYLKKNLRDAWLKKKRTEDCQQTELTAVLNSTSYTADAYVPRHQMFGVVRRSNGAA